MQELLQQIDVPRFRLLLGGTGLIVITTAAIYGVVP